VERIARFRSGNPWAQWPLSARARPFSASLAEGALLLAELWEKEKLALMKSKRRREPLPTKLERIRKLYAQSVTHPTRLQGSPNAENNLDRRSKNKELAGASFDACPCSADQG
jgi:hypothetical protein